MKQLKIGILLVIIGWAGKSLAYNNVPVQILLDKDQQSDTIGFNLVKDLPDLMYKYILAKKITLWNSPAKEVALTPEGLVSIEESTNASFSNTKNMVIYQQWSSNKKRSGFQMIGFIFLGQSPTGKAVTFGFVEARDVYQLLNSMLIPININGTYRCTYWDAVVSMRYNYTVLQFGKKNFLQNYEEMQEIKEATFQPGKPVENQVNLPDRKKISYFVLPDYNNKITDSKFLFEGLTRFFNQNLEVFFNMGGNSFYNHLSKSLNLKVTGIKVTEIWEKSAGVINYIPTEVVIFINNKPLIELSTSDINKFGLLFNFKSFEQVLRDKDFEFFITVINGIDISINKADKYYKALRIYSWAQLTEAVKYY